MQSIISKINTKVANKFAKEQAKREREEAKAFKAMQAMIAREEKVAFKKAKEEAKALAKKTKAPAKPRQPRTKPILDLKSKQDKVNKQGIKFTTFKFAAGFRYLKDFKGKAGYDFRPLETALLKLAGMSNSRKTVEVRYFMKSVKADGDVVEGWRTEHPETLYSSIMKYGNTVDELELDVVKVSEVPLQGACDTRPHVVTKVFEGKDGESIQVTVQSVKSTGDNCLINAMSQCAVSGRGFRADKFRQEMQIPAGAIDTEWCLPIAVRLGITVALYKINENALEVICQSETISDKHVNLLLLDGHYWVITSDIRRVSQISGAASFDVTNKQLDTSNFEGVQFAQTLDNPSVQDVQNIVDQGQSLLIVGAGGCGKTYLLKALEGVQYTATTACAAELLGGQTVQSYMCKNKTPCGERLVVDEVSMMGSCLFEKLYDWSIKGKKHAQLILSGDFLQLPPVNDRFFFQASSFYQFAKNTVLIRLTEVKRQDNKEQAAFLNQLREGDIDQAWIRKLRSNRVADPQLVLSARREFVEEYNKTKLSMLGTEVFDYVGYVVKRDGTQKATHNSIAIGAKAIITKNMEGVYNGQSVDVVDCKPDSVTVVDKQCKLHTFGFVDDIENGHVVEHYMPVSVCYALTIHKSQGQTVDSAVVYCDNLFEQGMAYVALSRVRDLNNLQICGQINLEEKGWQPNSYALEFYRSGKTISADQMLFIPNTKKQLKGVKKMQWKQPHNNHIYIDFETYLKDGVQIPYYNHLQHMVGDNVVTKTSYFDQLWEGGVRCNVGELTWQYIEQVACEYGDNIMKVKGKNDEYSVRAYKAMKKQIPTIVGYNLSGFDLHFLMQQYLKSETCQHRFKLNMIYKATSLIFFQVFDRVSQEVVLRTHDMFQILGCGLKKALTDFCGATGKKLAEKIEFKDEILFIMNNYAANPNILEPSVVSNITKRRFVTDGSSYKVEHVDTNSNVCLYDAVIRYADNDTEVLPVLYKCVDEICKETLNANITDFLTAGSIAWYGFISHLPDECVGAVKDKHRNGHRATTINTKLYRCEKSQEDFVRQSIKGGRVCPRQHKFDSGVEGDQGVYLDISGMYASIMRLELMPYGQAVWMDDQQVKTLERSVTVEVKRGWRSIYDSLTKRFGLFICEVDFEENPMNLEPVVQYKVNGKTRYTVERRTDVLTSVDVALIIASGGTVYSISKCMYWEQQASIMNPWIVKCNALKKEGELEGNAAKKSFGKLLANSAYGQTLKRDQQDITRIVSTYSEADEFVTNNKLTDIFECGDFTVLKGEKVVSQESFITSRCSFIGSFVLAHTRGMVFDICEVACPNRYNAQGVYEQPLYGDTDSLVFRKWQADLLVQAGWVQKENGRLTDELADDKSHWFLPSRLVIPDDIKSKGMSIQQDWVWSNATEDEKRDPQNFFFWKVNQMISSAPKAYACLYQNNDGTKHGEKCKFKGVPTSALIGTGVISYAKVQEAYAKPGVYSAVLQGAPQMIKRPTTSEGSQMFSQVVDSNLRRDKPVSRSLFKTVWQGRHHLDENITVPHGWEGIHQ